jgi:hypothetical protein
LVSTDAQISIACHRFTLSTENRKAVYYLTVSGRNKPLV